jgi:hypothetical protein
LVDVVDVVAIDIIAVDKFFIVLLLLSLLAIILLLLFTISTVVSVSLLLLVTTMDSPSRPIFYNHGPLLFLMALSFPPLRYSLQPNHFIADAKCAIPNIEQFRLHCPYPSTSVKTDASSTNEFQKK